MKLPFRKRSAARREFDLGRSVADHLIRAADSARDGGEFAKAAALYEEVLAVRPDLAGYHVQHGHMLKELGDLAAAEQAYARAATAMPSDADLALQRGHLFKVQGRLADAVAAYKEAQRIAPDQPDAARELAALERAGWGADTGVATELPPTRDDRAGLFAAPSEKAQALRISAALAPGGPLDALRSHGEEIAIRGLGRRERTAWGVLHTLRGVRALRGFCVAATPVTMIELFLNGQMIHRGKLKGGYEISNERDNPNLRKYVFNVWIDLTGFSTGRYALHYRATKTDGQFLERHEQIVIAPPFAPSPLPDSDDDVSPADPGDPRPLDVQINSRPSMVRRARRALLAKPPKTVLVQRPDVLGDLVVTVPAIRRLREILPDATFVGMLSPANVDFARTLGLFDEIILTELLFDPWERRRVVSAEAQRRLAEDLGRYSFDLAIDLSTSQESRLLLPLSGAPVLVGFSASEMPNLTVEVAGAARDPYNGIESVPHTNQAMGLVEWLAAMLRSEPTLLSREDLAPATLAAFGLAPDARFAVLHAGGRWDFTRWPYFVELAQRLAAETDLHILLLTTDSAAAEKLPPDLAANQRFQVINRRLAFDELDALCSFSALFVGDDSGVKHLASMRGTSVISIQNARNNWCEWGHDGAGYVITRKVPCAGCLIQNFPESNDCGRDFVCITAISVDEVFAAAQRLLAGEARL